MAKPVMKGSVYHPVNVKRKSMFVVNVGDRNERQYVKIGRLSRPSYSAMMCVQRKNRRNNRLV